MSKKLYEESNVQAIADVIREKNGGTTTYKIAEMAQAIKDIPIYAGVEYIKSSATQWIDTGVIESSKETINAHFYADSVSADYMFGSQQSGSNMAYNSIYRANTLEYNWQTLSFTASQDIVLTETLSGDSVVCNVNGTEWTMAVGNTIAKPIIIFGIVRRDGVTMRPYGGIIRCYYFQLYNEEGVLVRDYVPVIRIIDKAAGLYDKVEQKFYGNNGSGVFTFGATTGEFYK